MKRHSLRLFFVLSLLLVDLSGLVLAFEAAYWTRFAWPFFINIFPITKGIPDIAFYHQTLWSLVPMCLVVFFYAGFYKESLVSAYDELIRVGRGVFLCSLLTMATTFAYRSTEYSRLTIGLWAVYGVFLIYLLREFDKILFRRLLFWFAGPQRVLVVGKGKTVEAIEESAKRQPFFHTYFQESLPEHLKAYLNSKGIAEILLLQGSVSPQAILETAQLCENIGVRCKVVPDLLEMRRGEIILDRFCGLPIFSIKSLSLHGTDYLFKRSFDVMCSTFILIVLALPLAFLGLLIRLDSPGPILFRQDRMGFMGRHFKVYKFRTMVADADAQIDKMKHLSDRTGPVFKMKNDPRITRVGRWMRRFSLDELPQILNVLSGDMSLVGPRPQVLWEAAHYDEHAKKRLHIKPGITGLWQVSGRAKLSYEEMINLDIFYLENWSLGLDLKIMLRTIPAIFAKEGAY